MTSPAELLRSHLTGPENALVPAADVEAALLRAVAGCAPRARVEVAALMVYAGPYSTRVPALESRPLARRAWFTPSSLFTRGRLLTPRTSVAPAFEPCRAPAARVAQAA